MEHVQRSALVPYSAEQMFALVDDILRYPEFLPWCVQAVEHERSADSVLASLRLHYGPFNESFTTHNRLTPGCCIDMALEDGPFRTLRGSWTFHNIGRPDQQGCRIAMDIHFAFSNALLGWTLNKAFGQILNHLMDAFCQRAGVLYGND